MESFSFTPETQKREDFEIIRQKSLDFLFSFEKPEFYMDKGGVGTVYEIGNNFCIKILDERHTSPNRHLFNLGNTPNDEAYFQDRMSHIPFEGKTSSPKLFGTVSSQVEGEKNALIMEKLNAVNLQHIVNESSLAPESFNLDDFFDDLEKYVQNMHKDHSITHNDLFARNIMVDINTGEPRMIDFGRSVNLSKITSKEERHRLTEFDWKNLEDAYEEVSTALQTAK